ncbi:sugar phosphate isomerase/epimerase family protein [Neobacillus sp. GCM10023253]|uniref:sugar phosphate isomerase/epimerase family protein n=1 Tax=Neobacillus sp. GCM10023253 TaxID=3252644 RepID=UPI003618F333
MKKGIHDIPFLTRWSIDWFLERAAFYELEGIELNLLEKEGYLDLNTSLSEVRTIAEVVKRHGLEVPTLSTGLHNQYALSSENTGLRKRGEEIAFQMIEIAAELGASIIQIVPGTISRDTTYEQVYQRSQESLALLASEASAAGVTIAVENVCNKFLPSPLEFARFLTEINHPAVKAYFDTGNAMVTGHPEHFIHALGDQIVAVHVKDYRYDSGDFTAPLSGDAEWPGIMNALQRAEMEGYLISTPPLYKHCPERLIESASADLTALLNLVEK